MLEQLAGMAAGLMDEQGRPGAIGIVCGNPMDAQRGLILSPPNLPGWDKVPVVDFFRERFKVPVRLMNDANAGALAEWRHGAGQGSHNLIFCTMGTGFGCGLILDGRLYEGTNGNAGEIGHIRLTPDGPVGYGKTGSVEGWCSGGGIARLARTRLEELRSAGRTSLLGDHADLTTRAVAECAEAGDETALGIFTEVGQRLGAALSMAIDLVNPDTIVIGSIFVRCEHLLRPAMEALLAKESFAGSLAVCRVVPAALGERIGDVAALSVAGLALQKKS